jgi:hypothetical protein
MCVCVSACVCVCPDIRFHISQRIFSELAGNLLRVMTRSVGSICFVCTHVRAKQAHMCAFAYFLTDSVQICWEHTTSTTHHKWQGLRTFHFHATRVSARVRERAWLSVCLSMNGFSSNLRWIYYDTSSCMGYVLLTHIHAPRERACASGRVVKTLT